MTSREDESHECHLWCIARIRLDGGDRCDVYIPQRCNRLVGDRCEYGITWDYGDDIRCSISLYHVWELTPGGVLFPRDCALPDVEHIQSGCISTFIPHVLTLSYHYIRDVVLMMDTRTCAGRTHIRMSVFFLVI